MTYTFAISAASFAEGDEGEDGVGGGRGIGAGRVGSGLGTTPRGGIK